MYNVKWQWRVCVLIFEFNYFKKFQIENKKNLKKAIKYLNLKCKEEGKDWEK